MYSTKRAENRCKKQLNNSCGKFLRFKWIFAQKMKSMSQFMRSNSKRSIIKGVQATLKSLYYIASDEKNKKIYFTIYLNNIKAYCIICDTQISCDQNFAENFIRFNSLSMHYIFDKKYFKCIIYDTTGGTIVYSSLNYHCIALPNKKSTEI